MRGFMFAALVVVSLGLEVGAATPPPQLSAPSALQVEVDRLALAALKDADVPALSIAVLENGHIALVKAYGIANVARRVPARPAMRFCIGSISKQFLAVAMLQLQEQGRVSLDDPVGRYFPNLTRAADVRIRDLLTHTSGYRDYWPQDYVPAAMRQPIERDRLLHDWAEAPLDFEPGTQFQYSNTGYVVAGAIIEQVTQRPLFEVLHERIFAPLGMTSVVDINAGALGPQDATGYTRFALGPPRPAPKEGAGWLFAAGGLAMTAEDLARWNQALLERRLLSSASYRALMTTTLLANGASAEYGLGLDVKLESGRRVLGHSGEVSGFTADNLLFPDDGVAVIVLSNKDAVWSLHALANEIATVALESNMPPTQQPLARVRRVLRDLQRGTIDRTLFTPNGSDYFTPQAVADFKSSLGPLGRASTFTQVFQEQRGGMELRVYDVTFPKRSVRVLVRALADGRFEEFLVVPN